MMNIQRFSFFFLRIAMGWMFFYAGITKVFNPTWSAAGYLVKAKTFPSMYAWFASPDILPLTNAMNEWGLTLLGVSLLLGLFVRFGSWLGIALMALYYFPVLEFPKILPASFLIDQHVIYAGVLWMFATHQVGRIMGLDTWCAGLPVCKRYPWLRSLLG